MTKAMRLFAVLGVAVLLLAATSPVSANCNPGKTMGQLSDVTPPQITHLAGVGASTAFPDVIGRFWQAGARASANEGTYDASQWLRDASPIGHSDFIMNGFLGDENVVGCPTGDLITVVQSPATNGRGAYFVVARVTEQLVSSMTFDYTQASSDGFNMKPLSQPRIANAQKSGTGLTMDVTLPDASPLFYGVSGALPSGTITGVRLMRAAGQNGREPGPAAALWTYTNKKTTGAGGGAVAGVTLDCAGNQDVYLAAQLEFDGGAVLSDYVGEPTRVNCNSGQAVAPGKDKPKSH
ncbi:MAG: hypothetical protein LAO51_20260 [Acidobacteriia bacterium]|nr:hypothetical protein [Terriglobia bacterium]